jgi:hypothetical protein
MKVVQQSSGKDQCCGSPTVTAAICSSGNGKAALSPCPFTYRYLCFMSGNVSMKKKIGHIQGLFFSMRLCPTPKSRMRLHTALRNLSNPSKYADRRGRTGNHDIG